MLWMGGDGDVRWCYVGVHVLCECDCISSRGRERETTRTAAEQEKFCTRSGSKEGQGQQQQQEGQEEGGSKRERQGCGTVLVVGIHGKGWSMCERGERRGQGSSSDGEGFTQGEWLTKG